MVRRKRDRNERAGDEDFSRWVGAARTLDLVVSYRACARYSRPVTLFGPLAGTFPIQRDPSDFTICGAGHTLIRRKGEK